MIFGNERERDCQLQPQGICKFDVLDRMVIFSGTFISCCLAAYILQWINLWQVVLNPEVKRCRTMFYSNYRGEESDWGRLFCHLSKDAFGNWIPTPRFQPAASSVVASTLPPCPRQWCWRPILDFCPEPRGLSLPRMADHSGWRGKMYKTVLLPIWLHF